LKSEKKDQKEAENPSHSRNLRNTTRIALYIRKFEGERIIPQRNNNSGDE
jgi:hypothetical protein